MYWGCGRLGFVFFRVIVVEVLEDGGDVEGWDVVGRCFV